MKIKCPEHADTTLIALKYTKKDNTMASSSHYLCTKCDKTYKPRVVFD